MSSSDGQVKVSLTIDEIVQLLMAIEERERQFHNGLKEWAGTIGAEEVGMREHYESRLETLQAVKDKLQWWNRGGEA